MEAIDFWIWFANNKKGLEDFIRSDFSNLKPYKELSKQIKKFDDLLIAEITMDKQDNNVLIVSCDGRKESIPYVEELVSKAPIIDNWIIKKYRQPGKFNDFKLGGLKFDETDVLIKYQKIANQELYDIEFFIKGFKEGDKRFGMAAVIFLDHCIGEYNAMAKIHHAELKRLDIYTPRDNLVTLDEFAKLFE